MEQYFILDGTRVNAPVCGRLPGYRVMLAGGGRIGSVPRAPNSPVDVISAEVALKKNSPGTVTSVAAAGAVLSVVSSGCSGVLVNAGAITVITKKSATPAMMNH